VSECIRPTCGHDLVDHDGACTRCGCARFIAEARDGETLLGVPPTPPTEE